MEELLEVGSFTSAKNERNKWSEVQNNQGKHIQVGVAPPEKILILFQIIIIFRISTFRPTLGATNEFMRHVWFDNPIISQATSAKIKFYKGGSAQRRHFSIHPGDPPEKRKARNVPSRACSLYCTTHEIGYLVYEWLFRKSVVLAYLFLYWRVERSGACTQPSERRTTLI